MNPNDNQTVTVYRKSRDADGRDVWERNVYKNCFFHANTATAQNGTKLSSQNVYVARIPEQDTPVLLREGDIIVRGEALEEITGTGKNTATEILHKYQPNAFRVTSFSDNSDFPVDKHYRAGG